jgi:hypothetical protein
MICLKPHFLDFRPTDYQGLQPFASLVTSTKYLI